MKINFTKKLKLSNIKNSTKRFTNNLHSATAYAFLSLEELLNWTEKIFESSATVYDKAMDFEYLKSNIGGGNHRLFDGGHDLKNAFKSIKNAKIDDNFMEEVDAYFNSILKDVSTNKGLPFLTWNQDTFNKTSNWIITNIPFTDKSWVYDLASYDIGELFVTSLGTVGAIFSLNKNDITKLSEYLGSIGIISIMSANLLLGLSMIILASYSYFYKKHNLERIAIIKGSTLATTSMIIFKVLSLPIFLELVIAIIICKWLRKILEKDINVQEIIQYIYQSKIKQRISFSD